jgi:hypothetical protein
VGRILGPGFSVFSGPDIREKQNWDIDPKKQKWHSKIKKHGLGLMAA